MLFNNSWVYHRAVQLSSIPVKNSRSVLDFEHSTCSRIMCGNNLSNIFSFSEKTGDTLAHGYEKTLMCSKMAVKYDTIMAPYAYESYFR